jgi:hypothetical protein
MLERKINPLRRGRIPGKGNGQQKKSSVGEITDPFSVLNDSISTKGRSENLNEGDYIPSERIRQESKTTTVDVLDPLLDQTETPAVTKKETKNFRNNRCRNTQKESEHFLQDRYNRDKKSALHTSHQQSLRPTPGPFQGKYQCDGSKKCAVKNFFYKILRFFGFQNSPCCSSNKADEIPNGKCKINSEKHNSGNRTRGGNRNHGRHHRPPSKKI